MIAKETPLLKIKLYVPPVRPGLVSRPRLVERLNASLSSQLTLLSAPAGFGKTTLLSEWVHAGTPRPIVWVSLDETDNDPVRFLAYLDAALEEIGVRSEAPLPSLAPISPETAVTALINHLTVDPHPFTLILDDYHLITARPIHDAVAFLIEHLPATVNVIVATRADPPFPLHRLRGRGQLIELRMADLRFTSQEAADFLNQAMHLDLSPEDIEALNARAEGWVAGLQMAAASMQGLDDATRFIHAFTGSDRYILDYLIEEVFHRQPDDVQTFLLHTAILDRLTSPLCDAVTGRSDSRAMLEQIERSNLFVAPLDNERRWYRYHRLFADLLRKRLHQHDPDLPATLHRRASDWYAQNGHLPAAVDHALAAQDVTRAAALVAQTTEATLMHGEIATFAQWMNALPETAVRSQPSLYVFHSLALLVSGASIEAVEARLHDAERHHAEVTPGRITALRALIAAFQIRFAEVVELSYQALRELPRDDVLMRSYVTWLLGAYGIADAAADVDVKSLDEIARTESKAGNVMIAVMATAQHAEQLMRCGRLHDAGQLYRQALELATDSQGQPLPIAGGVLAGLGDLAFQWNRLDEAVDYLHEGIQLMEQWTEIGALEAYLTLARIKQACGDLAGAHAAIRQAQQRALQFDATQIDDIVVAMSQAQVWLAEGNVEAVERWAAERGLTGVDAIPTSEDDVSMEERLRKYESLVLVQLWIAQGRTADALALLAATLPLAEKRQRPELLIRIHLLRALAFHAQSDVHSALGALETALALGEPEGYVRPFLDAGPTMAHLLYQAAEQGASAQYVGALLAAFDTPTPAPPPSEPLIEPLSQREIEVLQLIAAGCSNQDIAHSLVLALSTVKVHTYNIYSKLAVHSRTQAIARARALGILPPK
ncbi:MAG: tetratricopeptide repeat protein [Anaerolineae bacterium]|nr:tetratricopeptide repeat protein [Anaerolineae bacterium]